MIQSKTLTRAGSFLTILGLILYLVPWIVIFGRFLDLSAFGTDVRLLYPAGQAVLKLQDPYLAAPGFYSPPWMLLLITPLSLLPLQVGYILWTILGMAAYWLAFRRLGMDWLSSFLLLFSPLAVGNLIFGNFDWLILLGSTLPPVLGIWFLALKPQLGIVLAGLWSWLAIKRGWRALLVFGLPIAVVTLASFVLGYHLPRADQMSWSADVWPWGIPIGGLLAYFASRRQDPLLALAAAPFLSPYVVWHSWIVALLPLHRRRWTLLIGIFASWLFAWWVFSR